MDTQAAFSDMSDDLDSHPLMQEEEAMDEGDETESAEQVSSVDDSAAQAELLVLKTRNDQLMRIAADFENYKRRQDREKEELAKFAGQQLLTNLLPVIDNFERALQTETKAEELETFVEGVRMIHKQLIDVLKKSGAEPIEAVGQPFNPEFHEAIMSEENDEVPDETVISEFQRGYIMHGRLLRPAIVKISKAS
ncbi:MAG: nucleotide exchange factor GrpE [Candidatus Sericytochromatia bacterium]